MMPNHLGLLATVEDLINRWRPLSQAEQDKAAVILGDASALIRDECPGIDQRIADGEVSALTVTSVVCQVVKSAMQSPVDTPPVASTSQTLGQTGVSFTLVNPAGDLYVTRAQRRRLGYGLAVAETVSMIQAACDAA
jgi:hypothetical protein